MESKNEIKLNEADCDQLIEELKNRESITDLYVCESEGATIKTSHGRVAVLGEAYIFVIRPNKR